MDKYFWVKLLRTPNYIFEYDLKEEKERMMFEKMKTEFKPMMEQDERYVVEIDEKKGEVRVWKL